jgi:hypothetical protein
VGSLDLTSEPHLRFLVLVGDVLRTVTPLYRILSRLSKTLSLQDSLKAQQNSVFTGFSQGSAKLCPHNCPK